ncbi:polysaccharide biosynthesis/export family protein [Rhizobium giardinii]|uniref:Polysaccharide export outer membrane protein n=1 Tax=Rhizobium giardinii TaxID=56731 RepID=A0A7W8X9Q1_9HYPH|nr:polysaccharide biosynthesis/export family protein [Rhizobium giardinii]MBB5536867.1 polysaccharide export outer membrane protein [Rhizobium giardinii]
MRASPVYRVQMQFLDKFTKLSVAAVCVALSSCTMPSSGPSANKIQAEAKEQYAPYTLINVTSDVVSILSEGFDKQLAASLGNTKKRSSALIGVGDTVIISIWEASPDGLFSSSGRGGGTQIPEQPVSEAGTISVPYAGIIKAANRTPEQVKESIEKALVRMAVQPQVLVSVVKNVSNTVTVTGEVANSGRIPLSPRGEKLLDVIAMAGGPRIESHQLSAQITRGRRTETIPMERLISDPSENIYVQPDDVVALIRQPRSFTVFGASTANASIQFDESQLYLNQALAKVGGLNDERANAKGIFIYRTESTELLRQLMPQKNFSAYGPTTNVIYQVDLTDPSGFFLLKSFNLRNRDLIYIANSSLAEVRKFATLVSSTAAPVAQAASVTNTLSDLRN